VNNSKLMKFLHKQTEHFRFSFLIMPIIIVSLHASFCPIFSGMNPIRWSSCSKQYLADAFEAGMDYCLKEKPTRIYDGPICGNSFVEPGEECDCGLEEECESFCCNPATCKLFSNATCATGTCCDKTTCQVRIYPIPNQDSCKYSCQISSGFCPPQASLQNTASKSIRSLPQKMQATDC
jgi:hypothetical protein